MNNINKTINFFFFFIFFVSSNLYAQTQDWVYSINFNGISNREKKMLIKTINNDIELAKSIYPNKTLKLNINVEYKKNKIKDSYSEDTNDSCSINIYYNSKNKIFFEKEDFDFIFLHELSHCILGYQKLYEYINWSIPLEYEQKNKLNNTISLLEDLSFQRQEELDSLNSIQSGAPIPHPMIVYHEMFADIQSLDFLIKKTNNISLAYKLNKIRKEHFQKKLLSSSYASNFTIPTYIAFLNKKMDNDETKINYIVQLGFVNYLEFINTKYNLRKKNE